VHDAKKKKNLHFFQEIFLLPVLNIFIFSLNDANETHVEKKTSMSHHQQMTGERIIFFTCDDKIL
jgi:hypothetical protein